VTRSERPRRYEQPSRPPQGGPGARGAEGPPAVGRARTVPEESETVETAITPPWMTILHNCDCHTFEEVVKQLMKAIACSEDEGWRIAWQVHNTGRAVVKIAAEAECVRVGNILAAIGLVVTVVQS
jgi:ATP-dependent Clp protease adapter protein ClpS